MTDHGCELFLRDPGGNASHLDSCASCRELVERPDAVDRVMTSAEIETDSRLPERIARTLPLAPWEGAGYRSWPIALGVASIIVALASTVFVFLGISPLTGFSEALSTQMGAGLDIVGLMKLAGSAVRQAPPRFHVTIAVGFFAVNILLVVLLRRAPKGADVTSR